MSQGDQITFQSLWEINGCSENSAGTTWAIQGLEPCFIPGVTNLLCWDHLFRLPLFLNTKQFLTTRVLGCDPPWSFMGNFFWTGKSWLLQKSPAQRVTLIHYNVCNMEQWNNSIGRGPRGHLAKCPTHSMANFKVLGQAVTIHSYCLKALAF